MAPIPERSGCEPAEEVRQVKSMPEMPMHVGRVAASHAFAPTFTTADCTWPHTANAVAIRSANGLKAYGTRRLGDTST